VLRIANITDTPDSEWDDVWQRCYASTYYHSRDWAEIWRLYTNDTIIPTPKTIIFTDGVKVVIPLMRQNYYRGIIKRYGLAGPPSEATAKYGNWLTYDVLGKEHITILTNYIVNKYKNLVWQLNPYDEDSNLVEVTPKYTIRKTFIWYMINLTQGEDYLLSKMSQNCRNKIKQGIKNKLVIKEGKTISDWKSFYEIYQNTINRWGKKTLYRLEWKFFEILYNTHNKYSKLWLTLHDGQPISGCICFYSGDKIVLFQSVSLSKYQYLRPVNLEKYYLIKDGIEKGYKWLDMGTAGRNVGLDKFKKSFGPEERMRDMLISWNPIIHYLKRI
jgi:hypothetical protein